LIHFATVHWKDDRWIEPQREYLDRHVEQPFRVWADLEDVSAPEGAFHHVQNLAETKVFENGIFSHTEKLNALATAIAAEAAPDDVLLFLDGDAFPIGPLDAFLEQKLARVPLVAVRRDENLDDEQPHPSFCATTVGFWTDLGGDWNPGYMWQNAAGKEVTDAGGNLLGLLRARRSEWQPLFRSNRVNLRPLWFGVYGDIAYHHGAGFRGGLCRRDREAIGRVPEPPPDPAPDASAAARARWRLRALKWYWIDKRPVVRRERDVIDRNRKLSDEIYDRLRRDPDFWTTV
jgi:hypothetical protein